MYSLDTQLDTQDTPDTAWAELIDLIMRCLDGEA